MSKDRGKAKNQEEDYAFGYRDTTKMAHNILWITAIFIFIGVVWAYNATLDEVTVAQGKVIPSKQMQVIQNLEGGIIKEILVHQGEQVQKGQILAYLDNTRFASEYDAAMRKKWALQIKIIRLEAEVNKKPMVVSLELQKEVPDLVSTEKSLYTSQINQLDSLAKRESYAEKELAMTKPLIKDGAVSEVDVMHLQSGVQEIQNQILTLQTAELDDLDKSKAELASLESDIEGIKDRYQRTTVRSPIKGIINEIYVTTVGGVLKPGDNIMDIVPLDDTLLVEARVRPSDIGFIHVGQDATVKITAYDYSIYGGFAGKVEYISSDTLKDEKKDETYYDIRVRTKQNYLRGKDGKPLYIIPGMTASVDILTGHKSVLEYILKPIIKAKQSALRER